MTMSTFWKVAFLLLAAALSVQCQEGAGGSSSLHDPNRVHDAEHIREHMKDYMEEPDDLKLNDHEAMEFHYFKLHDYDNNNKLDGLELGAAMTHFEDHSSENQGGADGGHGRIQSIEIGDDELKNLIEAILKDDDLNNDGYIDYYEFTNAQRRHMSDNT